MKRKIGRKTFIETRQVAFIVDSLSESDSGCPHCANPSRLVSPLLAARLLPTDTRAIYRFIESDQIHFIETEVKQLFVCLETLSIALSRTAILDYETKD